MDKVSEFESSMLDYFRAKAPDILEAIRDTGELSEEVEEKLGRTIEDFKKIFEKKDAS